MTKEIKNVNLEEIKFYEDTLLGAKDDEGNIWLAINKTCQCLGFDEADSKNQITKIKKDEVLNGLSLKFQTEVLCEDNSIRTREMLFLSEKAVTLWLAKISITNNMKNKYPELSEKLIKYQLECAKVLHEHFMGTEEKKEQFFNDTLGIDIKSIINQNNYLIEENKVIKNQLEEIHNTFEDFRLYAEEQNKTLYMLVQRFNIYDNESIAYTRLVDDFNAKIYSNLNKNKHYLFWEAICDWIGLDLKELLKEQNKKKYLLDKVGFRILEYFVDNVILGRIAKNDKGHWINLNGFNSDPFSIEKNKILKHWTTKNGDLLCCYCGYAIDNPNESVNYDFEHYINKTSSGSTNTIENIGVTCKFCNKEKNSLTYDEYIKVAEVDEVLIKRKYQWDERYA